MQGISVKQQRGIFALITSENVEQAALKSRISPSTLYRWQEKDPCFRDAYQKVKDEAFTVALTRIQNLANSATTVLEEIMTDREKAPSVRVVAARSVLETALKVQSAKESLIKTQAVQSFIDTVVSVLEAVDPDTKERIVKALQDRRLEQQKSRITA